MINREKLVLEEITGEPIRPVKLTGEVRPPEPWENGLKDTVIAYPGEVTRQGNRILITRSEDFEEVIFFQCCLELFGMDATFGSFLLFE